MSAAVLPSAPAALRNRGPIADVLRDILPERGMVLEIASGTGEHAEFFAASFPDLHWQPSEADAQSLDWITARVEAVALPNLRGPILLDVTADDWPVAHADAVLCSNMVHISPWTASVGLLRGSGRILAPGAPLILYGPYRRGDVPTAPSNEAFDASLKMRDPAWGLRNVEDVQAEARRHRLEFERLVEMPANNLVLLFRKSSAR